LHVTGVSDWTPNADGAIVGLRPSQTDSGRPGSRYGPLAGPCGL